LPKKSKITAPLSTETVPNQYKQPIIIMPHYKEEEYRKAEQQYQACIRNLKKAGTLREFF